jgi:2-iminobutanoate/2-iminopropanoate deaminase
MPNSGKAELEEPCQQEDYEAEKGSDQSKLNLKFEKVLDSVIKVTGNVIQEGKRIVESNLKKKEGDCVKVLIGRDWKESSNGAKIEVVNPATGEINGDTIETQAEQVMKNLGEVLKEAGSSFEKAVKTTCFLADMGDFAKFNEVYAKYFVNKPARSCVAVKTLPKNVLCEVEVIAEV